MDNTLIRALRYLHSSAPESQDNLRLLLEESLKNKYGQSKEIGPLLNVPPKMDYTVRSINTTSQIDHILSKDDCKNATSDNELELDLLKEDLMCIVCKGMGVGARNRLVECGDCHNLYHQECHNPSITEEEIESSVSWICTSCKEIGSHKKVGISSSSSSSSTKISTTTVNPVSVSARKFTEQDAPDVVPPFITGKTSSSKSSSNSSSSNNRLLTPNINIISADKRLQIMKKKAAKMQEKRKLSRP